jgi:CheY-like chemotaxis protein
LSNAHQQGHNWRLKSLGIKFEIVDDGLQAIEKVQQDIPVVALTANAIESDERGALKLA